MDTDIEVLSAMLIRAGIQFKVDAGHGWHQRIVLDGDRCFVFQTDGSLAGIRTEDDTDSFDGD
jgi:hypothetical protein